MAALLDWKGPWPPKGQVGDGLDTYLGCRNWVWHWKRQGGFLSVAGTRSRPAWHLEVALVLGGAKAGQLPGKGGRAPLGRT